MQMPSSAVVTLSDPDEYAAAFRNARVEITVIGRGQFTAELTSIDLHRLQMQRYHENLPRVVHWAGTSERAVIAFRTEPALGRCGDAPEQPRAARRREQFSAIFRVR